MKKITKFWLIVATLFIFLGSILFTVAMSINNWNFSNLGTVEYETNSYTFNEDFENIEINTITTEIIFKTSNTNETKVECLEMAKLKNSVSINNNTLSINHEDLRNQFDFIGINTKTPSITIYLPSNKTYSLELDNTTGNIKLDDNLLFSSINIESTTGNVYIKNISCDSLNIYSTTGDVSINSITCKDLTLNGSSSDININNTILNGKLNINITTGDVELKSFDAREIHIKSTTGDIEASLLSEKEFIVKTATGDIEIPRTNSGGICEIATTTGDIEIYIKK